MTSLANFYDAGRAIAAFLVGDVVAFTAPPEFRRGWAKGAKRKSCSIGYSCGSTCINVKRVCGGKGSKRATTFADYLKKLKKSGKALTSGQADAAKKAGFDISGVKVQDRDERSLRSRLKDTSGRRKSERALRTEMADLTNKLNAIPIPDGIRESRATRLKDLRASFDANIQGAEKAMRQMEEARKDGEQNPAIRTFQDLAANRMDGARDFAGLYEVSVRAALREAEEDRAQAAKGKEKPRRDRKTKPQPEDAARRDRAPEAPSRRANNPRLRAIEDDVAAIADAGDRLGLLKVAGTTGEELFRMADRRDRPMPEDTGDRRSRQNRIIHDLRIRALSSKVSDMFDDADIVVKIEDMRDAGDRAGLANIARYAARHMAANLDPSIKPIAPEGIDRTAQKLIEDVAKLGDTVALDQLIKGPLSSAEATLPRQRVNTEGMDDRQRTIVDNLTPQLVGQVASDRSQGILENLQDMGREGDARSLLQAFEAAIKFS